MSQTTIEGLFVEQQLQDQGFAVIKHGIPPELIDALIADYAVFTDNFPDPEPHTMNAMMVDPDELDVLDRSADTQTEWNKYRTNQPHFAKPNGYTNRSYQAEVLRMYDRKVTDKDTGELVTAYEDPKEYFHYSPGHRQAIENAHKEFEWGHIPSEVSILLTRFHTIHGIAVTAMSNFYGKLEETHPDLAKYTRLEDLEISPLRLLFYHPGQGDVLAGGHFDRGLGTLQIAESHMGLRTRNPQTRRMRLAQSELDEGLAFTALRWNDETLPGTTIKPLWHDVINKETPNKDRHLHGGNVARWSLIFFTNSAALGAEVDKHDTHTESN